MRKWRRKRPEKPQPTLFDVPAPPVADRREAAALPTQKPGLAAELVRHRIRELLKEAGPSGLAHAELERRLRTPPRTLNERLADLLVASEIIQADSRYVLAAWAE
jgi:hypothetical protein